jgi:hypothetical protein
MIIEFAARLRPVQVHDDAGGAAPFSGRAGRIQFKCRTEGADLAPHADEIRAELASCARCAFRDDELAYLRGCAS